MRPDAGAGSPAALAEAIAGAAAGLVLVAAGSLLLYGGAGALTAAGALFGLGLAALGAGAWAGAPAAGGPAPRSAGRWRLAAVALLAAGLFSGLWTGTPELQRAEAWRAGAVLILLGAPAYTLGLLGSAVVARGGRGAAGAATALLGGAAGALVGGVALPKVGVVETLLAAGAGLAVTGVVESRRAAAPLGRRAEMMDTVVLVTGVGREGQVGYAVARGFVERGARVVVTNIHESVRELAGRLGGEERVGCYVADLTRSGEVADLLDDVKRRFGRLDVLVNVAGGLSVIKPVAETSMEEWKREMERNAQTVYAVSRAALPMLRAAGGCIINFASPAGQRAQARLAAYSAAKAAVIAFTRALALEEARHGVRVNAVAPGVVDTESNRASAGDEGPARFVPLEQLVDVVLFLASDAAAGVTGETIRVPGRRQA